MLSGDQHFSVDLSGVSGRPLFNDVPALALFIDVVDDNITNANREFSLSLTQIFGDFIITVPEARVIILNDDGSLGVYILL